MPGYLFTSESVGAGHPDKIADQISDAVLDEALRQAQALRAPVEDVRCACETMVKTGMVIVSGEIRSVAPLDVEKIVRDVVREIGYDRPDRGFDADNCAVINAIGAQSADIAQGVDKGKKGGKAEKPIGAGDQGLMFGYACRETPELMPLPIQLSRRLMRQHAKVRQSALPWLGPDAKAQVTIRYSNGRPDGVEAVVLSSQHDDRIDGKTVKNGDKRVRDAVIQHIIAPVLGQRALPPRKNLHINPTGRFVIGGPKSDCGLTGRKIIADSYGGSAPHGGGAFSGKDPTKVDRSAAYMMRYVAKNIVAAGLADKCLTQTAYAIGVAEPVSLMVETYGSGKLPDAEIENRVRRCFDLTPAGIVKALDLWRPIYRQTAANGHFGDADKKTFTWERTDMAKELLA